MRDNNLEGAAWQYERWRANYENVRHLQWDKFYETNYTRENPTDSEIYGPGARSNYMVEERHTDQRDWNLVMTFHHLFKNGSKLNAGLNLRRNRTEYYSEVKDLLGGDYWVDEDKFAERDFASPTAKQNNLEYYNKYGHAHAAKVGDKYSYDYYAHVLKGGAWLSYQMQWGGFAMTLGGEIGATKLWREGLWQKGLFADNSKGDSEKLDFLNYKGKVNLAYRFSAAHSLEANFLYMQQAPDFKSAFVSPRTRNSVTPNLEEEKVLGVDASYNLRYGDLRARISGYYTVIKDQTKLMSYYDDVNSSFTNFAMSGIDKLHFGLEAAVQVPIYRGLSLRGALSWGQYTYTSNPDYVQTRDNSAEVIFDNQLVPYWAATPVFKQAVVNGETMYQTDANGDPVIDHYKKHYVPSTPQFASSLGFNYRTNSYWFFEIAAQYFAHSYLDMNPLYRTDMAVAGPDKITTPVEVTYMTSQEEFDPVFLLNASIGKSWYIDRKYNFGFSLNLQNITNNRYVKTGGYEQTRLIDSKSMERYYRFDSKYFYMQGFNYMLNLYFRF